VVEKSLGKIEEYNEEKLASSILKAFNKRNISIKTVDRVVYEVEQRLLNKRKITSQELGLFVIEELKKVDEVAYIRYASVYYNFQNAQDYLDFIARMK